MIPMIRYGLVLAASLVYLGCRDSPSPSPAPSPVHRNPVFLTSPVDQTVKVGHPATFTSLAIGQGAISYQWYLNGSQILGAQSPNYSVAAATLEEDGSRFTVAAVDSYGSAWSFPATLHVQIWLATMAINGIQITLPDGPAMMPGLSLPSVVAATQPAGPPLLTVGRGGGKVSWDNFTFKTSLVTVNGSGIVTLPQDPRVSDGVVPQIQVSVVDRPDLTASLDIPVRYDGAFLCDFTGAQGTSGSNGYDGFSGFPGSLGSCDPDNPQAGGNGTDGSSGGNGGDGGPGAAGADLQAWVCLHPGQPTLLEVKVVGQGLTRYYLVDPKGGRLTLTCDGGAGGPGGNGGQGGYGGSGGYGCPNGMDGMNGWSGANGSDGFGGNGGTITVWVDPLANPFLATLQFSNKGGSPYGIDGPPPSIQVGPVPPLW